MPNIQDHMNIRGRIDYVLRDEHGNVKQEGTVHNTITVLHDCLVADRLCGGTDTLISFAHAGTGTGGTSANTNLVTPCAGARTAITSLTQGAGGDDNDAIIVFTFGAGVCTATSLTEIGLLQTIAGADLQCYDDTILIKKGAGDTLTVTWTITYGAS